jgi:hypothetical protein
VNKSEDEGASFVRKTVYTEQMGDLLACGKVNPLLAVDWNNNVYVAWMESHYIEGSAEFNFNLYLSKLANDQRQFSEIKMIGELGSTGEFMAGPSFLV